LLTECVNDKSSGSQEEIDNILCWSHRPITLFLLKLGTKDKAEQKEESPRCNPFSLLPSPYHPEASQLTPQDYEKVPTQELHSTQLEPLDSPLAPLSSHRLSFPGLRKELQQCQRIFKTSPFLFTPGETSDPLSAQRDPKWGSVVLALSMPY
jgi:hypothetical protein